MWKFLGAHRETLTASSKPLRPRLKLVERIIARLDQLGLTRSSGFVLPLIDQLGEVGLEVVPHLHLACLVTPILLEATRELAENGLLAVGSGVR